MKRLRSKLTYSNLISTLCLALLVCGGTAYAATHLPKNSVGTTQIKRAAVTPAKLSKGAKKTLAGRRGPVGPQGERGERGEKGDPGTRGPSDAITKFHPGAVAWATTPTTVSTVSLHAGSWVVTATGLADNFESSAVGAECRLLVGGTTVDASGEFVLTRFPEPGSKQPFSLSGGATVTAGGTAELQCEAALASGQVVNPGITAIQVGELKTE